MITFSHFDKEDWPDISEIYQEGINTKMATFETQLPDWSQWDQTHIQRCRIKALKNGIIIGWAALSPISKREVYKGVAEVSIYISKSFRHQKIGTHLLHTLIEESKKEGFWTLQANIFSINTASIRLHQKAGFRVVGIREKIARLDGEWYDNTLLEKRHN
ncbi:GNAT family N-acetyltransferase [Aquimarina hainanensis]|uniref:GNAT family N-acetyltransferase n=1 Tax=Aquimarina hainanensis TaxID=1578017 RepID=A0ABW5N8M4_9FLAO|nr:GNAT family N-acetyltransferase [Aquimarina sp. TRL1]QKX04961.1 N-acetyltransferase [Aquimarina sp. TRL1]